MRGLLLRLNLSAVRNFALVNTDGKAALRICTSPSFVRDSRSFLTVVREWYQNAGIALQAIRKI